MVSVSITHAHKYLTFMVWLNFFNMVFLTKSLIIWVIYMIKRVDSMSLLSHTGQRIILLQHVWRAPLTHLSAVHLEECLSLINKILFIITHSQGISVPHPSVFWPTASHCHGSCSGPVPGSTYGGRGSTKNTCCWKACNLCNSNSSQRNVPCILWRPLHRRWMLGFQPPPAAGWN